MDLRRELGFHDALGMIPIGLTVTVLHCECQMMWKTA